MRAAVTAAMMMDRQLACIEPREISLRHDNEVKTKRIVELEEKAMNGSKKLAKLELSSGKGEELREELKRQNSRLIEKNADLIQQFTTEIQKMREGRTTAIGEGVSLSLKSQVVTGGRGCGTVML